MVSVPLVEPKFMGTIAGAPVGIAEPKLKIGAEEAAGAGDTLLAAGKEMVGAGKLEFKLPKTFENGLEAGVGWGAEKALFDVKAGAAEEELPKEKAAGLLSAELENGFGLSLLKLKVVLLASVDEIKSDGLLEPNVNDFDSLAVAEEPN